MKKEKGLPYMLAPRKCCLDYSKVYSNVTERWLLAWDQNKNITYYIFHILIPKSVLVFLAFARNLPTVILVRAAVSLSTFRTSIILVIMDLRILNVANSRTFPFPRSLADSYWSNCPATSKILSSSLKKKTFVSIKN